MTPVALLGAGIGRRASLIAGIVLILAAAVLYGVTLDDGLRFNELAGGDLITHQYAEVQGRAANAPGYPAYTMLGWLWFRLGRLLLPWANATQVLSLFSTLWALAALAVFYLLLLEITPHWPLAFVIAGFYAVTYFFWYYAVTSEQYASAVFQNLLFALWALRWERTRADRYMYYSALNAGFCLANLVTVCFAIPPLIWFYLRQAPGLLRRGRLLLRLALLLALPLLCYAYVYYVGATQPAWRGNFDGTTWAWFWDFLSTGQGRSDLTWGLGPLTAEFPWLIAGELTWGVLAVCVVGLAFLSRRRSILIYATLVVYLILGYIDRFGNWYQVLMPIYPLLLLGGAALLGRLWDWVGRRWPAGEPGAAPTTPAGARRTASGKAARMAILLALTALVVWRGVVNWPHANQHGRPDALVIPTARALIADAPAVGAWIYGSTDEMESLSYLTRIWGERPDLRPATTADAQAWLAHPDASSLYVTRAAVDLLQREAGVQPSLSAAGATLIEVLRQPRQEAPAGLTRLDLPVVAGLNLVGVERRPAPAGRLHLTLTWQATRAAPLTGVVISARPRRAGDYVRQGDQVVTQDHQPVWNAYPFERWSAGEVVRDDYVLDMPDHAGADGLMLLLYRPTGAGIEEVAQLEVSLPVSSAP